MLLCNIVKLDLTKCINVPAGSYLHTTSNQNARSLPLYYGFPCMDSSETHTKHTYTLTEHTHSELYAVCTLRGSAVCDREVALCEIIIFRKISLSSLYTSSSALVHRVVNFLALQPRVALWHKNVRCSVRKQSLSV